MKPSSPCHYCEARHLGCHSECEAYIKYCEELARINELIISAKEAETQYLKGRKTMRRKKCLK